MIVTPTPEPIRFETLLSLSWSVFRRNWIVALPPVIAFFVYITGIVAFIAVFAATAIAHHRPDSIPASVYGGFLSALLAFVVVMVVVGVWAYAAMFGMADAAWATGRATFGDGFRAFRRRGPALFVALIAMAGLAIVAVILALPTLGIALLAFPLATMYVIPSVISGGHGGFTAIGESFRLVRRFFATSAISLLVLLAIQYGVSMLGTASILPLQFAVMPSHGETMPHMPPIGLMTFSGFGLIISIVAGQAYMGFFTVALVGLYRSLFVAAPPLPPPAAASSSLAV